MSCMDKISSAYRGQKELYQILEQLQIQFDLSLIHI